jgi:hypothetical protein
MFGMELDEKSKTGILKKLIKGLDSMKNMNYILEREFGKVPADQISKDEELESATSEGSKKPYIVDEMTINQEISFNVGANVGADIATNGHFMNCHSSNKLKIAWEQEENAGYLKEFTVYPQETINFKDEKIKNLKVMLYGDNTEAQFKFILK